MKKLTYSFLLLFLAGCANLTLRPQLDYNEGPYFCTKQINKCIKKGNKDGVITKVLLPVFIIDWPFDAIVDTLLLPYDIIAYSLRMRNN